MSMNAVKSGDTFLMPELTKTESDKIVKKSSILNTESKKSADSGIEENKLLDSPKKLNKLIKNNNSGSFALFRSNNILKRGLIFFACSEVYKKDFINFFVLQQKERNEK